MDKCTQRGFALALINQMTLFLLIANGVLVVIALAIGLYLLMLRRTLGATGNALKAARRIAQSESSLTTPDYPIMRFQEYQQEFGSRSREIAIIALHGLHPDTLETIAEFTETMRENGSYIYHFTNYWGGSDPKEIQRVVTEAVQKEYHGIFTIGSTVTRLAKNTSTMHNKNTPIVFARLPETTWQREQAKKPCSNITGVAAQDCWALRIRTYLAIKPFMRSVLIPATHPAVYEATQEIAAILNSYGVTAYLVRVHGHEDLVNTLSHYADKIDSVILSRDPLGQEYCSIIAKRCSDYGVTLFSPYLQDIHYGAAVGMSTVQERFGFNAAKKMLAIIEEKRSPSAIPVSVIGQTHQFEVHFNQLAMQAQGLDPSRITTLALQHGSKVYTTLGKEGE